MSVFVGLSVCLSVCHYTRVHLISSVITRTNFIKLPAHAVYKVVAVVRSSSGGDVATRLCTAGFLNDLIFSYNGPYNGQRDTIPQQCSSLVATSRGF